jgi:REP element-mobilizing transposase RayT/CheY-like chemotaxis protein
MENFLQNQRDPQDKPSILVVTPSPELGEIICESLKEMVNIEHFTKASKAISSIRSHEECKQAILDMELGEVNLLNLGRTLRLINPTIELLLISKEEPPTDLEEIQPWKFLRKPLLLHDLQAALGIETAKEYGSSNIIDLDSLVNENREPLHWSNNSALATRYLARLIEKSFAQEALLIQNQALWSYAGRLPEESVYELNDKINKCMEKESKCDFTRFIRLETTQTEHALYASLIAIGVILALVFDPDIPFGIVRKQTKELATTLLLLDSEDVPEKAITRIDMETKIKFEEKKNSGKQNDLSSPILEDEDLETESMRFSANNYFDPRLTARPTDKKTDQTQELDISKDLKIQMPEEEPVHTTHDKRVMEDPSSRNVTQSGKNPISLLHEFIPDDLYNLTYSCLLIPRFRSHHMTRDRENTITDCIKKLHISYGWRLEMLEVQSEYLRWASSFPPNFAPSRHIDTIRKETSKRLFEDFPQFKEENLSGDYWAPGFLIMGGVNAISDQLVLAYTNQNRQKHGLSMD